MSRIIFKYDTAHKKIKRTQSFHFETRIQLLRLSLQSI